MRRVGVGCSAHGWFSLHIKCSDIDRSFDLLWDQPKEHLLSFIKQVVFDRNVNVPGKQIPDRHIHTCITS